MPESFVAALGHEKAALPLDVDWILVLHHSMVISLTGCQLNPRWCGICICC